MTSRTNCCVVDVNARQQSTTSLATTIGTHHTNETNMNITIWNLKMECLMTPINNKSMTDSCSTKSCIGVQFPWFRFLTNKGDNCNESNNYLVATKKKTKEKRTVRKIYFDSKKCSLPFAFFFFFSGQCKPMSSSLMKQKNMPVKYFLFFFVQNSTKIRSLQMIIQKYHCCQYNYNGKSNNRLRKYNVKLLWNYASNIVKFD